MSIFAEPSETLCGERQQDRDVICVNRAGHETGQHIWNDVHDVVPYLESTGTPCKWANPFPGR